MIKAIVLDIDGTLLNSNHTVSEKTKEKIVEIQKKGIKVLLASGRPTQGMWKFVEQLELDKYKGFLVSYNGAVVTDCRTKKEIYKKTMDKEIAKKVLIHAKSLDLITTIYYKDYLVVEDVYKCDIKFPLDENFNILKHESRGNNLLLKEVKKLEDFLDFNPTKILISSTPSILQENHKELARPFQNKLNYMFTAPFFFEFTDLGVDKATALEEALPKYGIKKENIMAFGDGQNDKSMIEYAGIGVAMGNAITELKDVADYVTLTNDEDGIVFGIDKFIN